MHFHVYAQCRSRMIFSEALECSAASDCSETSHDYFIQLHDCCLISWYTPAGNYESNKTNAFKKIKAFKATDQICSLQSMISSFNLNVSRWP